MKAAKEKLRYGTVLKGHRTDLSIYVYKATAEKTNAYGESAGMFQSEKRLSTVVHFYYLLKNGRSIGGPRE